MFVSRHLPALSGLGFTPFFHQQFLALDLEESSTSAVARVAAEQRSEYLLLGPEGSFRGVLSGRLRHALPAHAHPCVGDWVLVDVASDLARVEHVFERATLFSRKASGRSAERQAIAANVDVAFVVAALSDPDADRHAMAHGLNVRRLERYARAVEAAGVRCTIVLNKADLHPEADGIAASLRDELAGADVVLASATQGDGLSALAGRIGSGETAVLVGSSGVGKSSLTNRLLGTEVQRVSGIREVDARGRHTTTQRVLFRLPSGGLLVDTPGMREFALWADEETDLDRTGFEDVDTVARDCRYRDCLHEGEPGCAVLAAVERGELTESRVANARKLRREMAWQKERHDALARQHVRSRSKAMAKGLRARLDEKGRRD